MQFLKSKWLHNTANWALYKDTDQWRMNGDWPHYHSVVQTYKMFLPANLHQGLLINMIATGPAHASQDVQGAEASNVGNPEKVVHK